MTEQSKTPARIWADMNIGIWLGKAQPERRPELPVEFIRADLVEQMAEALRHSQSALAMMIAPEAIKSTSVLHAFTQATEAECKVRTALSTYAAAVGSKEARG